MARRGLGGAGEVSAAGVSRGQQDERWRSFSLAIRNRALADLGLDVAASGVEVAYPSLAEQAQILVRGIGLQPAVAEEVLARTGTVRESDGGLLWPLQVVAKLARSARAGPQRRRIRLDQRRLGRRTSLFRPTCKRRSRSSGRPRRSITRSWRVRPADATAASSMSACLPRH